MISRRFAIGFAADKRDSSAANIWLPPGVGITKGLVDGELRAVAALFGGESAREIPHPRESLRRNRSQQRWVRLPLLSTYIPGREIDSSNR